MANMSLKPNSRGDLLSCSPPTTHTHTHTYSTPDGSGYKNQLDHLRSRGNSSRPTPAAPPRVWVQEDWGSPSASSPQL